MALQAALKTLHLLCPNRHFFSAAQGPTSNASEQTLIRWVNPVSHARGMEPKKKINEMSSIYTQLGKMSIFPGFVFQNKTTREIDR